jgi:hypothetical protein
MQEGIIRTAGEGDNIAKLLEFFQKFKGVNEHFYWDA